MRVFLKISKGWSKPVENHNKETCDIDGQKLWIGPGNQVYCDAEHDPEDIRTGSEAKAAKRREKKEVE
jgi:hypothetical protein